MLYSIQQFIDKLIDELDRKVIIEDVIFLKMQSWSMLFQQQVIWRLFLYYPI